MYSLIALITPPLPAAVAAFEHDDDALAAAHQPALDFDQLDGEFLEVFS
jgi:hypothetical protein